LLSGESGQWFQQVLWDISQVGYDAEWDCISAANVGAAHRRDRVWIVAHPTGQRRTEVVSRKALISNATGIGWSAGNVDSCGSAAERLSEMERLHSEPAILGVDDGIPNRAHRLRGLGNAIVPQVAEVIFRSIDRMANP